MGLDEELPTQGRDGHDDPPSGGGRNLEVDFKGEKRSIETHESTTDPDARLYRKGAGMGPARLGMKIATARGMARARVAVARKLAFILHRMWSDRTAFRFGREPAAVAVLAVA